MEQIGERIRKIRAAKGYSQEYMAFKLNMSQSAYSSMERGVSEIPSRRLCEIADLLEVSPMKFLPESKYSLHINLLTLRMEIRRIQKLWHRITGKRKK
ncbi:MAG TPA: helix-turn-helix transcriptional regulator [Candidatus Babeliaceae bacterium]|nr:helix-turn-helix transcriptional regulator [Candidatus Babeliaceae bacterium]